MDTKMLLSEYLKRKRKELNLSQKELAARLDLPEVEVSKWEQGIKNPDLTLVSRICEELHITPNELVNSCDNLSPKGKRIAGGKRGSKAYLLSTSAIYLTALVTCLICDLALNGALTWFTLVLPGVLLAFSVTDIPVMVKRHRTLIAFCFATLFLYILLYACNSYVSGDWLFAIAYPLATVGVGAAWLTMTVIVYLHANPVLKSGFISLVWAGVTLFTNPLCLYLLGGEFVLSPYFNITDWQPELTGSKIAFWALGLYGIIALVIGIILAAKRRHKAV